ncbi:hypothetical protein Mgra_00009004 [Meloidogyne graminicola]|uniref:Potassium channel domain-containing protein n=1 Tax=Meloidogyne graminicola TaxID=189291 RepID=A0A8S9ZE26_9BILA|nr:hypothetical protein Mgra_00009004 [Meloidogyne graminicola]
MSATKGPILDNVLPPKWDAMSSTLYALSILTTTGYASATPNTPLGQWLSIGYGLLGIPLTVLAAVDVGRFLSDVVLAIYDRILKAFYRLRKLCCQMRRRRTGPLQNIETNIAFNKSNDSIAHKRRQKQLIVSSLPSKNNKKSKTENETNGEETKRRLPLSVNAAILLLFCMLGGWVYMAADGSGHTFIEGFFVTFNLVANLTMSEMPTHISYLMTLIYIFVFVFFGLAVLSMCADLAASELKWMFLKIHYFGRKINWAKRRANKRKQEQMEMEVKELLLLIDQIRAKYPEKEDISSLDILKYVQELNSIGGFGGNWSHKTFSLWLLQHQRRNTMAFTPQSFEALKFADEMDQEEEQLLNSTVNALLINWRRQKRRGEQNTFIPLLPFGV